MVERNGKEREEENGGQDKPGILDRVGDVAGAAKQRVQRSAEVMTGADIRKFEDFTEAATTAIIGVHQDQAELREQLAAKEQSVHDLQQEQATLRDDIARVKYTLVITWGAVSIVALALGILALLT